MQKIQWDEVRFPCYRMVYIISLYDTKHADTCVCVCVCVCVCARARAHACVRVRAHVDDHTAVTINLYPLYMHFWGSQ